MFLKTVILLYTKHFNITNCIVIHEVVNIRVIPRK